MLTAKPDAAAGKVPSKVPFIHQRLNSAESSIQHIYLYMYISIYVYVYMYTYIYIYVYMYICMYIHIYLCVYIYVYISLRLFLYQEVNSKIQGALAGMESTWMTGIRSNLHAYSRYHHRETRRRRSDFGVLCVCQAARPQLSSLPRS